jgi:hypothetical protein
VSRRSRDVDDGASTLELTAVVTVLGGVGALAIVTMSPLAADAVAVACRAGVETVRMAALAYETQQPGGGFAPDMATLVARGYLNSTQPDVSYTVTGATFDVRGTGSCAP